MDSTVLVQQYIQQLIKTETFNIDLILEPPEGQDEGVWKYEHLRWILRIIYYFILLCCILCYLSKKQDRFLLKKSGVAYADVSFTCRQFCMELNGLAVRLQEECNPETCTQMTATEQWIFLCAAHKTPKEVKRTFRRMWHLRALQKRI